MRLRLIPLLLASLVIPAFADISDDLAKADRAFDKGNYRDAFHYYSKYAEEGNAHARARLAMMYEKGILVGKDLERAQALYQGTAQALEQAAAPVAPAAGETGSDSGNDPAANPDNQAQAAQAEVSIARPQPGNAEAQYRLALAYLNGHGMPKDAWKGAELLKEAASENHREAQALLATLYREGHGVERDGKLASEWYRRAAEQGHAESQYRMGLVYVSGEGVLRDETQAADYFRRAAEQNHSSAQYYLARSYEYGKGVEKDITYRYIFT